MRGKTGLSVESKPCPTPQRMASAPCRTTSRYAGSCTSVSRSSPAGRGASIVTFGAVQHAELPGERHGQRQPDRVQRVLGAQVVGQELVVPDDGDRVAHAPDAIRLAPRGRRHPAPTRRPVVGVACIVRVQPVGSGPLRPVTHGGSYPPRADHVGSAATAPDDRDRRSARRDRHDERGSVHDGPTNPGRARPAAGRLHHGRLCPGRHRYRPAAPDAPGRQRSPRRRPASASPTDSDSLARPTTRPPRRRRRRSADGVGGGDDPARSARRWTSPPSESPFGTGVSFGRSSSSGCQIRADGRPVDDRRGLRLPQAQRVQEARHAPT